MRIRNDQVSAGVVVISVNGRDKIVFNVSKLVLLQSSHTHTHSSDVDNVGDYWPSLDTGHPGDQAKNI